MEARFRPLLAGLATLAIPLTLVLLGHSGAAAKGGKFANGNGAFHVDCFVSHSAKDDPIVFPRGKGKSHLHDFVGPSRTDAYSTNDSIRKDRTNCTRTNTRTGKVADKSAYWAPALYVGDQKIKPSQVGIYYKTGTRDMNGLQAFPKDLRVIAGDAKGQAPQTIGAQRVWFFECRGGTLLGGTETRAPLCKDDSLELTIAFPDCWDGKNLDSKDHKSHMAYSNQARQGSNQRVCPSTHPREVPMLSLQFRYPTRGGPAVRLASGAVDTAHADFMNGWEVKRLQGLVRDCLARDKYCGGGDKPVPGHQTRSATGPGV